MTAQGFNRQHSLRPSAFAAQLEAIRVLYDRVTLYKFCLQTKMGQQWEGGRFNLYYDT